MTSDTLTSIAAAPLENRALSIAEAAAYCGIAAGTLRNRISLSAGPRVQRIGRRVVVRLADLEAWLASKPASLPRVTPHGEDAA